MALVSGIANAPILPPGWEPVNHSSGHTFVTAPNTQQGSAGWKYNYDPVNSLNGVAPKQWANARDTKGNLWVWIPRYSYRAIQYADDPEIKIRFSDGINDNLAAIDGRACKKHSAFKFGNTELTGIWVAKYAASKGAGDIPEFKPDVEAWRSITVNDIFNKCLNLKSQITTGPSTVDSHMLKNIEWGAAAMLAKAIGKQRPDRNSNSNYRTGYGLSGLDTTGASSTTGNMTGIFDMVGNTYEYVASYVNNGHANLNTYCKALVSADAKYKDVLPVGTGDTQAANYSAAAGLTDGMLINETSTAGEGSTSWKNWNNVAADSYFPYSSYPVFLRGGYYYSSNAGLAYFNNYDGNAYSLHGFRACFVNLNSAPLISGSDTNLGNKNAPFSHVYQVSDPDGDNVTVTEKINGQVIRSLSNVPQNQDLTLTITQEKWNTLAINTEHTLTITADDGKGGITTRIIKFMKTNAPPVLTGKDEHLGDKNMPFSYTYQVYDPDGDAVTIVERLNGTAMQTRTNVAQNTDLTIAVAKETLYGLAVDSMHTISIEASDDKGNTAYRNVTFRRVNAAAVIETTTPADLGEITAPPTIVYKVSDPEGDSITVTEYLNGQLLRTIEDAEHNAEMAVTIPWDTWVKLKLQEHTVKVRATDSLGAYSEKTFTFTRVEDRIQVSIKNPIETPLALAKVVPVVHAAIPSGYKATVMVTNNAFDDEPIWEDATQEAMAMQAYEFQNSSKTADKWGFSMKIIIAPEVG